MGNIGGPRHRPPPPAPAADHINKPKASFTINLSSHHLSAAETSLLDKGLTFIPTYNRQPLEELYTLQHRLVRNLKLKDYFSNRNNDGDDNDWDYTTPTFKHPSNWTPADDKIGRETIETTQRITHATERTLNRGRNRTNDSIRLLHAKHNISIEERRALISLRGNNDIVIKPADKGSAVVVMDKTAYLREAYRQLNNARYYKKLTQPVYPTNVPKINSILRKMHEEKYIDDQQLHFLSASNDDRPRRFYLLPKIHKPKDKWPFPDMPDGRPIVSDTNSESCRIAKYIDYFLRPISSKHPAYLKDTYDFVSKIRGQPIPMGAILVTADVTSLYTNMTIDRMLDCAKKCLAKYPAPNRPDNYILQLLELTLRNNDFTFNAEFFLQICGTAMGKAYAPSLADEYLEDFDEWARTGFRINPLLYFRYLDDVFFVWIGTVEELKEFETFLNGLIPGISITFNYSTSSVDFLDTTIYTSPHPSTPGLLTLQTKVFFKPTDTHQLLHPASFHPRHTFMGVLKSQFLRFKRISSTRDDYNAASHVLMTALAQRSYNKRTMRAIKRQIWDSTPTTLTSSGTEDRQLLPIVVPYNDVGSQLAKRWIKPIKENPLFQNYRVIRAFTTGKNLQRSLVRSQLDAAPHRTVNVLQTRRLQPPSGSFACTNPRCLVCTYMQVTRHVTSHHNGRTFPIIGHLSCKTQNVVYVISCGQCGLQYVGETSCTLANRFNNHLSTIRTNKNTPIAIHFNLPGHSIADVRLTGIEALPATASTKYRRIKESTWQNLLQTHHPFGINNLKARQANPQPLLSALRAPKSAQSFPKRVTFS